MYLYYEYVCKKYGNDEVSILYDIWIYSNSAKDITKLIFEWILIWYAKKIGKRIMCDAHCAF